MDQSSGSGSTDNGRGEDSGGGGGGGGGDEGGGDSESESSSPARTFIYQAEAQHAISGSYSGVQTGAGRKVVKLSHPSARLEKRVSVPAGNYWLDVQARHDQPGPVQVAIYVNDKAWKVFKLDRGDNSYRTERIGMLRNFSGGTIRWRFLNGTYDRAHPANEATDRNLFIDWWRLTTGGRQAPSSLASTPKSGRVAGSATSRSAGWQLLPQLNSYIRRTLGQQFVTPDIWQYYARRLTAPTSTRESIQDQARLQTVMRYWWGARPGRPRGD